MRSPRTTTQPGSSTRPPATTRAPDSTRSESTDISLRGQEPLPQLLVVLRRTRDVVAAQDRRLLAGRGDEGGGLAHDRLHDERTDHRGRRADRCGAAGDLDDRVAGDAAV